MQKPDFSKIWKWVIQVLVSLAVEVVANTIGIFQGDWTIVVGIFVFLILLALTNLIWNAIERFVNWLKTPDRKLLILEPISSQANNQALLFTNREFRAPSIKIEKVYLGYEQRVSLSAVPKEDSDKVEQHPYHLNWQKLKVRLGELPIKLPKSKKITIDFVKINAKNNQFYFDLEEVDKVVFDVATHIFQVAITYDIKKEMWQIKRYKVRVSYQGSDNLEIDIEHFD